MVSRRTPFGPATAYRDTGDLKYHRYIAVTLVEADGVKMF